MKALSVFKSVAVASVCAFALVAAMGCSSGAASGSTSAGSAAASEASSAAASEASAEASAAASEASAAASEASVEASAAASEASVAASEASAAASEASAAASGDQMDAATAAAQGYQVFEGTVLVGTAEEVIAKQGVDIDPAVAGGGGTYAVLVFDTACDVTGMQADGSGEDTRTANMLGIAEYTDYESFVVEYGDLAMWEGLNGQHVSVAAKADAIMFPSDVRLPIGEPSASEVVLLS